MDGETHSEIQKDAQAVIQVLNADNTDAHGGACEAACDNCLRCHGWQISRVEFPKFIAPINKHFSSLLIPLKAPDLEGLRRPPIV